jgi:hypothetical protein
MTTSDLERRLAAVLHQHAEDAMNDTDTEDRLDTLLIGAERDTRRRRRAWATGALAAAAATAAVVAWAPDLGGETTDSGTEVTTAENAYEAEQVATRFLSAYKSFDRSGAAGYLADGVPGMADWRPENRWFEAVGFRMLLDPCRAQDDAPQGATLVACPYDYDSLGSDVLGRGPFTGSRFTAVVQDGKIVSAQLGIAYADNGFSAKVWEPFAAWVSKAHPEDAAVMYADWPNTSLEARTPRSTRLWRQNVQEYVQEQQADLPPG